MLETQRLILRQWQPTDLPLFVEMNADPEVMRFFPSTLSTQQSTQLFEKLFSLIEQQGWGWWAIEAKESGDFVGTTGLMQVSFKEWFTPATEIGWRIARQHWRKGYATEAANEALKFAKHKLALRNIVSFTTVQNTPSIGVMEKLGMQRTLPDFDHPNVAEETGLRRHALYEKQL
ncbi:GNAT family N-acetyltransferase [Planctobacterium marinum]|uniref:N-acetyltransferase n=1 Tax=Planctobacterium marinum TaxID=1631968 RepID=A0AA48HQF6_9ALTE|nr:N-acetyltransferase [Planctobacterium marinum]